MHVSSPLEFAYCPVGHCVHVSVGDVIVPLEPAVHWQSVTAVLVVATVVAPWVQSMQVAALVAPRYLPISHSVQVSVGVVTIP